MHVINQPDQKGSACNFIQHGLMLPTFNAFTMPNFPNYFLGADSLSICDTIMQSTDFEIVTHLNIYPNPARDIIYLSGSFIDQQSYITIKSILGKIVIRNCLKHTNSTIEVYISNLPAGAYNIEVINNSRNLSAKFIKIE